MNAIVTGATRGIGRAIALNLAQHGYNLAICARNAQELKSFAQELKYTNARVFTFKADCSIKEEVYAFCQAATEQMGAADVLVNNAGTFIPGLLLDEADDVFDLQLGLNLKAAYYCAKYFGKIMRERQSGHIFNICSVASKAVVENAGSYSVTKSALLSLNDVLRQELSKYNVKVTAILPGSTLTSSWDGTQIPPERFVQPEDIAKTLYTILNLSKGVNVDEVVLKPLQF